MLTAAVLLAAWGVDLRDPGVGLDPSWGLGLAIASHDGLHFGRELQFTYGPLGWLDTPFDFYSFVWQVRLEWLYALVAYAALAWLLLEAGRCSFGLLGAALVAYAVLVTVREEVILAVVFLACALPPPRTEGARRAFAIGLGALVAVALLGKLSAGVSGLLLALVALAALRGRREMLGLFGASCLVGLLALWLASGQSLADVGPFVANSASISFGYPEAQALDAAPGWQVWAAAAIVLLGFFVARAVSAGEEARARWALPALWVVFAVALYKEGFTRHDQGHSLIFFSLALAGFVGLRWAPRRRALPWLAFAALWLTYVGAKDVNPTRLIHPLSRPQRFVSQLATVSSNAKLESRIDLARERLARTYHLRGRIVQALVGHTVWVEPSETPIVWAYGLRWRPAPVFEPFSAYTPRLDHLNARTIASPSGPERILVQSTPGAVVPGSIDGRMSIWDAPASTLAIFCHFRPGVSSIGAPRAWLVLIRSSNRCGVPRRFAHLRLRWRQTARIPTPPRSNDLVYAEVHGLGARGTERLRTLAYRGRPRYVVVNRGRSVRLVPATAADGLTMSAPEKADSPPPFALAPAGLQTIAFTKQGAMPGDARIDVNFYAVSVSTAGRPAPITAKLVRRHGVEVIVLSSGAAVPVHPGSIKGILETVRRDGSRLDLVGWAADLRRRRPARQILAFGENQLLVAGRPSITRRDIAKHLGSRLTRSGFQLSAVDNHAKAIAQASRLKVFALSDNHASELPALSAATFPQGD